MPNDEKIANSVLKLVGHTPMVRLSRVVPPGLAEVVVKVESLEGDAFRGIGPGFQSWNRGKRGIVLNLRMDEGREVLHRMVREADVVLENYRHGVARRLGADYEALREFNPQLIYCTVTAYGTRGPDAETPGFDPLFQAMSGAMAYQGGPGNPPTFLRVAISDYAGAIMAAWGVAMALFHRARTGQGQWVETCLLNSVISVQAGEFMFSQGAPWTSPRVESLGVDAAHRLYEARDGWLYLACDTADQWRVLCQALEREELVSLWPQGGDRQEEAFTEALVTLLAEGTVEEWVGRLQKAGVKAAPVRTMQEAGSMLRDQDMIVDVESPEYGPISLSGLAFRMSETPGVAQGPAPGLGQHTAEVLQELGYTSSDVQSLCDKKVVR
ncbi:MAG: CoA transferase [Chloroflexi bacterium]|nr:CoA transferase [Chloroflexota bacterium]